jgi:hypothetical protein
LTVLTPRFLAGDRALAALGQLAAMQRSLTALLCCGIDEFPSRIDTLQKVRMVVLARWLA